MMRADGSFRTISHLIGDDRPAACPCTGSATFGGEERQVLFEDRRQGGRQLAERLAERAGELGPDPIVLALPRGGLPVGFEVARRLGVPLDVFVVRKLGVPGHEELAMGAIASGGVVVLSRDLIQAIGIPEADIERSIAREGRELARREEVYRQGSELPPLDGRGVVLVDDGLATGATMLAAVAAVRRLHPGRITVAVPVAAPETCEEVGAAADACVCAARPEPFLGVGRWYEDFSQMTDDEVRAFLAAARAEPPQASPP
jgi:putative phosphoribosyl transferase